MKAHKTLMILIVFPFIASCVTEAWVMSEFKSLVEEWKLENPDKQYTVEVENELLKEAEFRAQKKAAEARGEVLKRGGEFVGHLSTGNVLGAIFAGLGLTAVTVGAGMKMRGKS